MLNCCKTFMNSQVISQISYDLVATAYTGSVKLAGSSERLREILNFSEI